MALAMSDLAFAPATTLAAMIAAGETSSREVVDHYLERIARHNDDVNAVVTLDAERARQAAGSRDDALRAGAQVGPLHGVPVTIKDAFCTAGLRTTAGLHQYRDHVPPANATAVQRLVDAGVVILGKTNCPPGVTGQETANELFGRTSNPWDPTCTSGASSGGAAAALAAGLTALELGSDSGGSIRQPASFCGVHGHFPTQGLVPSRGHLPQVDLDEIDVHIDLMSVGPLARSPRDLAVALQQLAGPDRYGNRAWSLRLPPAPAALEDFRVGVWLDDDDFPVDTDVVTALDRAADAMAGAGAKVDRDARPGFRMAEAEHVAFSLWVAASSERNSDAQDAEMHRRVQRFADSDDSRAARRARAEVMSHREWHRLDAHRRRLQRQWEELFAAVDVLLCPVVPVPAYPHDPQPQLVADVDHRLARTIEVNGRPRPYLDQLVWTTVVGMARLAATVAPVGRCARGLPIGVQIVGPALHDLTTIAFARHLADVIGGFRPPPAFA